MAKKFQIATLGKYIEEASIPALNRAAQTAVTKASSFVREKYNFKKSELDQHIKIISPAKKGSPVVKVRITNADIGLIHFDAKQVGKPGRPKKNKGPLTSSGVKATVLKGKRQLFRSSRAGAFIQNIKGGTQVFIRTTAERLPIIKMTGVILTSLFKTKSGNSRVMDVLHDAFDEAYKKRFDHELSRRLK